MCMVYAFALEDCNPLCVVHDPHISAIRVAVNANITIALIQRALDALLDFFKVSPVRMSIRGDALPALSAEQLMDGHSGQSFP